MDVPQRELDSRKGKTIECTPIVIDGVMYITTAYLRVVALDAATGKELWQFDPLKDHPFEFQPTSGGVNRGCAYWSDGKPDGEAQELFMARPTVGCSRSMRKPANSIGNSAREASATFARSSILWSRDVPMDRPRPPPFGTTRLSLVSRVTRGRAWPRRETPAFDVYSGRQVWRFHTVPHSGEFGNDTWEGDSWKNRGGANAWGGISVDIERGLVFAGLGSASFDFYGGDRRGDNLFANCTIALDAKAGKRVWHFQTLRHDVWDHDLPVYPNLVSINRDGKRIDAVAQVTKTGYVYLFDRMTGKPLFDIEERRVPSSDVPGEQTAATQPIPVKPPPFSDQFLDESNVTDIGAANRASVLAKLRTIRGGPAFNPPSRQGTVVVPGFHGGANWSGALFDPTTGLLYVNSNNVVNIITLVESSEAEKARSGPYRFNGYKRFLDHEGYPAIKPPWGQLNAINLNTGEFAWRGALGEHVELTARRPANRDRDIRWLDRDRGRPGVYRRNQGRANPRVRQKDRPTSLGTPPAGRRLRDSGDLRGRWSPIRGHRRRWRRQAANEGWRRVCGVQARRLKMIDGPARVVGRTGGPPLRRMNHAGSRTEFLLFHSAS